MLRNLIILTLCAVAINGDAQLSVLVTPKSINFKGNDVLNSDYVGDVLGAALGNDVNSDTNWGGMTIQDPFSLPKSVVAVVVDGVDKLSVSSTAKSFAVSGSDSDESVSALASELSASSVPVCDIDFKEFDKAVETFRSCFGDVAVSATQDSKNLKADKQFLQSLAYVNTAANNLASKKSQLLVLRLSLASVVKAHGEKSEATTEALKLVSNAVANLQTAAEKSNSKDELVVAIAHKSTGNRAKREAVPGEPSGNKLNLSPYFNNNYPVIFNIILWFMVVFGLSLLAICYAIGSMDPGRDSIIYRMTSTRMKKDN